MKLVSFNIWGGTVYEPLMDFLREQSKSTDIFCFQEVYSAEPSAPDVHKGIHTRLYKDLQNLLPNFISFFEAKSSGYPDDSNQKVDWFVNHGQAVFVRRGLELKNYITHIIGDSVADGAPPLEGLVKTQSLTLSNGSKDFNIINTHGMSRPGDKLDTPARIEQSRGVLRVLDMLPKLPTVLCGDFNLMPQTQTIKMLEGGMKNLIKEFKITDTRNNLSRSQYKGDPQFFADFAFTTPDVNITSFEVPYIEISDHLPMILEFEI